MLYGLIVFISYMLLGEFISALIAWPVPGSVLGMLLLFMTLVIRGGVSDSVKQSSQSLLPYLPLFIVPASVGIVNYMDLIKMEGHIILLAMIVSLLVGIPLCGWLVQKTMSTPAKHKGDQL
ncbi:CidA/LrgA family protein [Oceaniserpentilla sp. 4NH20-0058]|uniref:CidA/LrgA family protein n=1 Tax=Oceaniserpentilla sp. 4NH20-0058 TaxID=3127660 RepID=UPI0031047259